ncbi:MAG: hypothetical protein KAH18_09810 [Psychromonas sp.]|nr:hypothetical protein [Psychromonas sp.]
MLKHTIPNLFRKAKKKATGEDKSILNKKKKMKVVKRIYRLPQVVLDSLSVPNIYFETYGSLGAMDGAHVTVMDSKRGDYVGRYGMNADREIPFTEAQKLTLISLVWSCREAVELAYLSAQRDFEGDYDNLKCWLGSTTPEVRDRAKRGIEIFWEYMSERGVMLKFINVLNKEDIDPPWHVCSMMQNKLNDSMGYMLNDEGGPTLGKMNIYLGTLIFSNYSNKECKMHTILHEMSHRLLDTSDMYETSNKGVERFHAKQSSAQALESADNWARLLFSFVQSNQGLQIDLSL